MQKDDFFFKAPDLDSEDNSIKDEPKQGNDESVDYSENVDKVDVSEDVIIIHSTGYHCEKCGSQISHGQKFCNTCGHQVEMNDNSVFTEQNSKQKRRKRILGIPVPAFVAIVFIVVAGIIVLVFLLGKGQPKKESNDNSIENNVTSQSNNNLIEHTATDQSDINFDSEASHSDGLNFSLDQYTNHGSLSCNRVWCSQNVWSDELDKNVEQFAYFNAAGIRKSNWFDCEKYVPTDFVNDFVIISENTDNKKSTEKNKVYNYIYDSDFSNIATILLDKLDFDRKSITQFNKDGYAFTGGKIIESNGMDFTYPGNGYYNDLAYIDKTGAHLFDDEVKLIYNHSANINSDIYCEKDYIIVSNRFVCNKEGKLLVDVQKAVESSGKLEDYYTFDLDDVKGLSMSKRYDIVQFRDLAFVDDKSFSVEFVVGNLNSNVTVIFDCTLDTNGRIIEGPEKIYSGD